MANLLEEIEEADRQIKSRGKKIRLRVNPFEIVTLRLAF
ncbi:hypothetical protein ACFLX4_03370 [Chloroflexota bacterium]